MTHQIDRRIIYVFNRDISKGDIRDTLSRQTSRPHHLYVLDELSANGLYDLCVNVLDV